MRACRLLVAWCAIVLALAASHDLVEARIATVISGGGSRAMLGGIIALKELQSAGLLSNIKDFYGTSGGAWCASWLGDSKGDAHAVYAEILQKAKKDGEWGSMFESSQVGAMLLCGEEDGIKYSSCHEGWAQHIRKYVIPKPLKRAAATWGDQAAHLVVDSCAKGGWRNHKLTHNGQCVVSDNSIHCTDFAKKGVLQSKTSKGSLTPSGGPKLKEETFTLAGTSLRRDKGQWTSAKVQDWLAYASGNYAEMGRLTKGLLPLPSKIPNKARLYKKGIEGVARETYFCDAGAVCNLPLAGVLAQQTTYAKEPLSHVLLLDFSAKPTALDKCLKFWDKQMFIHIVAGSRKDFSWGFQAQFKFQPYQKLVPVTYVRLQGTSKSQAEMVKIVKTSTKGVDETAIRGFDHEWGSHFKALLPSKEFAFLKSTK